MEPLFFEDLGIGRRFLSPSLTMAEADMIAYARLYDPQPFHTDPAAAQATAFKGLAACGFHTASLTMRLLHQSGLTVSGGLIGRGTDQLEWPRPVRPGDTLRVEAEVVEAKRSVTRAATGWIKLRIVTLNQHDQPVQIFVPLMPVPLRHPGTRQDGR